MGLLSNILNGKKFANIVGRETNHLEVTGKLLKDIQNSLFEMLVDISNVCNQNNIDMFLCGGTLLGSIRHKGFIPWDDDIDIAMTRESYAKFIKVFEGNLSDKYILNAPNYSQKSITRFPKILKKDSLYVTGDTDDLELCKLFIDIFILDNIPDSLIQRNFKGLWCNILEFLSSQVIFYKGIDEENRIKYVEMDSTSFYVKYYIGKIFSPISLSTFNNTIDKVIQYKGISNNVGFPTGRKHYFGEILPRGVFIPLSTAKFNGLSFYVPGNYDAYLKNLYGDYMKIPDEKDREHHFVKEVRL